MNEPAKTDIKTSLARRTALETALSQVIKLNRMLAMDLRRYKNEPSGINLDHAHDVGLTLERALERALDRAYDA